MGGNSYNGNGLADECVGHAHTNLGVNAEEFFLGNVFMLGSAFLWRTNARNTIQFSSSVLSLEQSCPMTGLSNLFTLTDTTKFVRLSTATTPLCSHET